MAVLEQSTDAELILALAAQRSEQAFACLFNRYRDPAFNLARYLTRNESAAEEVVQEAMLDLWRSASAYQGGNARSWILGIVSHKSIDRVKKWKREKNHMRNSELATLDTPPPTPAEAAEQTELLSALREKLDILSTEERCLVALYYGAGCTYEEIGAHLSMPPQTVAFRVKKVLAALRTNLAQAGFAAAAPLLGAEGLQQALTAGAAAPAGLSARVLEGVARAAQPSLRASPRGVVRGGWGQEVLLPAGLVLAMASAVTIWWAAGSKPAAPSTRTEVPAEPAKAMPLPPAPALPKVEPLFRHWDFHTPEQAKDFKVIEGSWHHVPKGGRDGLGCMETETETFVAEFAPPINRQLPFRVIARICFPKQTAKDLTFGLGWLGFERAALFKNVYRPKTIAPGQWVAYEIKVFGGWDEVRGDNQRLTLFFFEGLGAARANISVLGRGQIDDLEIAGLEPSEFPKVDEFRAVLDKISPSKRVGQVPAPDLKSVKPPEPAYIEFLVPEQVPPAVEGQK